MDKACLIDQLGTALATLCAGGATVERREKCPTPEFVVWMPCYVAFFSVVESTEELAPTYATAEQEINNLKAKKGRELPRDLELVLLVAGRQPPDAAVVRGIIDDRYVCRKFVLWPDGRQMDEVLADLPFWPPTDLLSGSEPSITAGVQEALRGHDSQLISDLASHSPGAERIFEKIREKLYSLTVEPSMTEAATPPRALPSAWTKLEALDITDFRGIRHLRPEDMPLSGDVVSIYGPNGVGKTSVADALEWAITGQIGRLAGNKAQSATKGPDPILNIFSNKGEASVTCSLRNREPICRVKRGRSVKRLIGSRRVPDDRAVIDYAVGTKAPSPEARLRVERLRDLFRGSHMLSQHDIREFLERTEPVDRFDILTNMIGAEEFVRFREKVAAVLRHLRTHIGATGEQKKSLKREPDDISARLRERQQELEQLRYAVTAGKTPEEVAGELLKGLRDCQCSIDESAFARAGGESSERRFEFLAIHAESAIRGKKAAIEDMLVRLNTLEEEVQGYFESRKRCESLRAEIANAKSVSEKERASLQGKEKARQEAQVRLKDLRTSQAEAARHHADLTWLKENLPAYRQGRETLRRTEDALTGQRKELQKSQTDVEEQHVSLGVKRARLQDIEQSIASKMSRQQSLLALIRQLPDVQARWQEEEQLVNIEKQRDSQIGELKRKAKSSSDEVNVARSRLAELERAYESEAARHDVLSSFLVKLEEMVHSAECPLCGRDFATAEEAKGRIREHLAAVPAQLRALARGMDEAKKNVETKRAQADSIAADVRALDIESGELRLKKSLATKAVQDFLSGCAALAVTISEKDPASWIIALEQASRECNAAALQSEAASLREEIKSLVTRIANQQNTVDGLRRKLAQSEAQHTQVVTMLHGLEAEMAARSVKPGSLPENEPLVAEVSKAQGEVSKRAEAVAKAEAELQDIESTISGLRERLKRADEDVASKETQLRQYETTCIGFVAKCRAIGVSPENPKESMSVARQRTLQLNQSLSDLDQQRQILQQLTSLGRLKREIGDLAHDEAEVQRRAEKSLHEETRLRSWESHIEGLETEVVKGQVDVVGTHLGRLEPTTQRLYQRLNTHPVFGKVRIRVNEKTHELNVEAEPTVACRQLGDIAVSPSAFFSDAQLNSLAITVFLAGALRQRWSGLNTIIIDDPVQQMDDMNVCAFLDLIRGLSSYRQFIIFTCSREFYLLTLEKLGCLNKCKAGSFLAYRLEGIAPAQLKVYCDTP